MGKWWNDSSGWRDGGWTRELEVPCWSHALITDVGAKNQRVRTDRGVSINHLGGTGSVKSTALPSILDFWLLYARMAKIELLKEYEQADEISRRAFPPNFVFGVATSAYQVEGACREGNRGPSIWDAFTHTKGKIIDGSNGDIAVDQYHRYKEDVDLIAKLGFAAYRFSISWSRIFPDGLGTTVNEDGIAYYNNIINALLEKGIQPYVTLYHWDLPLYLHESMGGWLNKQIVKFFSVYADTCFANFGDRVKDWITINEPLQTSVNGYGYGIFAPGRHEHASTEPYLVAHHQLLAHAAAVSIYRSKYKDKQGGQIGIAVDCEWAEANSDKTEDKIAAARRLDFQLGWYLLLL
uniref:Beta-glucosidase 2 n=1 Tax=Fragaria ananassa TaxID=3747 RepID=K4I245_FRAAN|nr:beta-glucosidase 2 [Fragaria x ananassa]